MGKRTTAVRYARAILDVLPGDDDLRRVETDLAQLPDLFAQHPELHEALTSPVIPGRRRRELATKVLTAAGLHPVARRLLAILAEQGRVGLLAEIRAQFLSLCDERRQILPAEITTAVEFPADRADEYKRSLERLTGHEVRVRTRIDPAIIGGVVTRIGSQVYDGSVRGQLQRLHHRLRGE